MFYTLDDLKQETLVEGFNVRFVHGDSMTIAYWDITQGAILPEHSHLHEQIANIMEGTFELTINGQTKRMKAGEVAVIPPNAPHGGKAITDCRIIDVFHPVREDYLQQ